jgi:hypothetical protein
LDAPTSTGANADDVLNAADQPPKADDVLNAAAAAAKAPVADEVLDSTAVATKGPTADDVLNAATAASRWTGVNTDAPLDKGLDLAAFRKQMAHVGPLEAAGLLLKHFAGGGYGKSVEMAFAPNPAQPQIPALSTTGSTGAQIGKTLVNTASGAVNSASSPGVGASILTPGAGLYAVPYFLKKAIDSAPEAWKSFFDPNATAADRTQKTAATVLNALAGLGLAKGGLKDAAGTLAPIAQKLAPDTAAAVANRVASAPVRDAMAFSRDAADNNAERTANVTSNDIRGPLRRQFGDNAGKAENALSFMVEGLNDPTALESFKQKILASQEDQKAPPSAEPAATAAPAAPARLSVDQVAKLGPDAFNEYARSIEGGYTDEAHQVGLAAKGKPEEIQKLVDNKAQAIADMNTSLAADDLNGAMAHANKGQYFSEAHGAATGTGSAGEAVAKLAPASEPETAATAAPAETATAPASTKWGQRALDAIDFAQQNFEALKPHAERYGDVMLKQWEAERDAGQDTPFRPGYVMHAQDIADPSGFESISSSGGGDGGAAFRKMRTHDTFADSIAAGVDPKTLNSVDLMRSRLATGQKLINRNAWADSLKDMKDPTNGQPIAANAVVETRPNGSTYNSVPDGYQPEMFGSRTMAVQKGYGGIFKAITSPSALAHEEFMPMLQKANATGKSVNLLFDTFHLGRIAMWDSAIRASGLKTFKAPLPSYKQGLILMDHSPQEITQMANAGEVPKAWLPKLLQNKTTLELLERNGMNSGRVADAMHQEWVRKIPGIGQFNKFVFEKFQRGAMSEIGLLEFERQRSMYPELSDSQVARKVAKDVNTRFGNFGRQGILKSRTFQDLARMVILAPQWNEGLIKSELGAVSQVGSSIKDAIVNRRLASGMLARGTATMVLGQLAANQMINYFTRGKPTWENKEEGPAAKLSAWIPDKIGGSSGFFLNPTALAAETSHLFEKNLEKDPSWQKALASYGRSRLSATGRPIATFLTKSDGMGRPIKSGDLTKEVVKSAIPMPIASDAAASAFKQLKTGQPSESFAGQYQKQLMATVGLKTDNAPSAEQRIYALARDFNRGKGVPEQPQFAASDFEPFTSALRIGNKNDAREAVQELLEHKTPDDIAKHYQTQERAPFTGKHTREDQFMATLSAEQKATYQQARAAKTKLKQDAMTALIGYLAQNNAPPQN